MKTVNLTAAAFAMAAGLVLPAAAQERAVSNHDPKVRLDPFHFGLGALATWTLDAGEPSSHGGGDPKQYGLLLQKLTTTSTFAASGATLFKGNFDAEDLDRLAFDISGVEDMEFGLANGYCGAGAPRFNVVSNATATCFLGCAHGKKTQDQQSGWWTISFEPPFTQYPGCEGGVTGTVRSIILVFDEGTDVGPGSVVIDNVRVNSRVVGKPTGSDGHDHDDDDDLSGRE
jgi:hypothetical protein